VTVTGKTMRFYQHTYDADRTGVDAAISNFPMLLLGGQVIDSSAIQTAKQTQRGAKGSIGTDGTYVFLVVVFGATMTESASVAQALGETDAMNLDGGGSEAMFIDREYKVGPGRLLPNAVMLTMP
jgi:exopolysaccharide biosynthesis protein